MKAFEITLTTGETIYTAEAAHLDEVLGVVSEGTGYRLTIPKKDVVLETLKMGKKFTAKLKNGDEATIKVVEHDFAPVIVKAEPAKRSNANGWVNKAVEYIKSTGHYIFGSLVTLAQDGKRWWVVVDGERVFWTLKEERASLIVKKLNA